MNADHHDGTDLPTIEICGSMEYIAGLSGLLDLDEATGHDDRIEAHDLWVEDFAESLDKLGVAWRVDHGFCCQWAGRKWFGPSGRGWGCDSSLPPSVIGAIEAAAIMAEIHAERALDIWQMDRDADPSR